MAAIVDESGPFIIEIVDKKVAKKHKKEKKEKTEKEKKKDDSKYESKYANKGMPEGVKIKVGECCYLGMEEQLFDYEKIALREIKMKAADLCENFSDEFIMSSLIARKMNITRSIEFLERSVKWRKENNLIELPKFEDIPPEFWAFLHVIPGARDKAGRYIRYTDPAIHPNVHPWTSHIFKIAFTWINYIGIYSEGWDGIRNGMHVVVDMQHYGWRNFDIEIQKLNTALLAEVFPILTRRVSIVNPPMILSALTKIWKIFLKSKIFERIFVEKSMLKEVDSHHLSKHYGGDFHYSIENYCIITKAWAEKNEAKLRVPIKV